MERLTKTVNGVVTYIGPGNEFDTGMLAAELSNGQIRLVEVTPAPKIWGIPMLIQIRQWKRNIYSIKNCASVEEMRWYLV